MSHASTFAKIQVKLQRHGASKTAYQYALRALNSVIELKIMKAVAVTEPATEFMACPDAYTPMLLDERRLRDFARDPKNEMSGQFLDQALAKGDECYAILDHGALAAYGWYAFNATPLGIADLAVHFAPGHVYMYKGFTDTGYRGQRLHAIGMTRALSHYRSKGLHGMVSYVESTNFDSLKSCFRMGYRIFGTVYVAGSGGRYVTLPSPGCREFGFKVEPNRTAG